MHWGHTYFMLLSCLSFISSRSYSKVLQTNRASRFKFTMTSISNPPAIISPSLLLDINAYCGVNGLMYSDGVGTGWSPAPLSLLPHPYPSNVLNFLQVIQPIWHRLIDSISRDKIFLSQELTRVSEADRDFTYRLLQMYLAIPDDILAKQIQLGIFRSDYMLHAGEVPLQVEINTIAASLQALSSKVHRFHRDLLNRHGDHPQIKNILQKTIGLKVPDINPQKAVEMLHNNDALLHTAAAMAKAHEKYILERGLSNSESTKAILFVVQPNERNQGDQRGLSTQLWNAHKVKTIFYTLNEIRRFGVVEKETGRLLLQREEDNLTEPLYEATVVYFRGGYAPTDYPSENEWQARELLESCAAIKCPTIGYQLAGTKAIQAALCKPGVLEKYISADDANLLRKCFAVQFSLGDIDPAAKEKADEAIKQAIADGSNWVLKPQREGGGNNFYGDKVSEMLREHAGSDLLSGYVLMGRIFPVPENSVFYRYGKIDQGPALSEIGIFGTFLGTGGSDSETFSNEYVGYLVRTKLEGIDEGGVATGYSVINSLLTYDNK